MTGPWAKYQPQPYTEDDGPWSKFKAAPVLAPEKDQSRIAPEPMSAAETADDYANEIGGGLTQGAFNLAGAFGDAREFQKGVVDWGGQKLGFTPETTGTVNKVLQYANPLTAFAPTSEDLTPEVVANRPRSEDTGARIAGGAAELLPSMAVGPGRAIPKGAQILATAGATELAGPYGGLAAALLTGGKGKAPSKGPTTAALKAKTDSLYAASRADQTQIPSETFTGIVDRVGDRAVQSNIDQDLSPGAFTALKKTVAREGQPMTPDDIDQARQVLKMGGGSLNANDRRITREMVKAFDEGVDDAAVGNFKEARAANKAFKRSEMVDELNAGIDLRASQFTQSGKENAIRTEFRQLARNKNKMRQFDAETQAAIRKVAEGGSIENALRWLGKFAPTSVVSAIPSLMTAGGGLSLLGPAGLAAGAGLAGAGIAGRLAASGLTSRNKKVAEALIKGHANPRKAPGRHDALARALIGGGAAYPRD